MNQKPQLSVCSLRLLAGILGVSLAWSGAPARAQTAPSQPEIDALRQQLAEMQARLDKLEAAQTAAATAAATAAKAAAPTVTSASKTAVVVSGLLQVHSLNFLNETINNAGSPSNDTFRLRRGEIRLTAPFITKHISGLVMFDPAKTTSSRGNGATNVIRERDNILQEIQISYLLNKNATETNTNSIDVGQFKIPVGYESLTSSGALPLVERALIFTQRDPFDGGYGDVRDTGIQLRGTAGGQFDYRIGIFNGIGDRQNALSLRDNKSVLARIAFRPAAVQGLEVGVSGGQGNTGVQNFVTTGTGTGATTTSVTSRANRTLFNLFAAYKVKKLTLQGEYLSGKAAPILVGANTLAGRDIKGYYAHVGYLFSPKLEAILRYDYLDTDRNVSDATVTDIILGLNYFIKDNNAKIQTNLIRRSGGDNAPTSTNPSNNLRNDRLELRTSFQAAF